eukprot:scaffold15034_cov24-Tisochrysis_lutea.AAC.2
MLGDRRGRAAGQCCVGQQPGAATPSAAAGPSACLGVHAADAARTIRTDKGLPICPSTEDKDHTTANLKNVLHIKVTHTHTSQVGASMSASYGARMERVITARSNIEQRLSKKLELLEGYGRVMNMIEIEVRQGFCAELRLHAFCTLE